MNIEHTKLKVLNKNNNYLSFCFNTCNRSIIIMNKSYLYEKKKQYDTNILNNIKMPYDKALIVFILRISKFVI